MKQFKIENRENNFYLFNMAVSTTHSIDKSNHLLLNTSQIALATVWLPKKKRFVQQFTATQTTCPSNRRPTKTAQLFSEMPGRKGLSYIGTLMEYIGPMRKEGSGFHKLFKVMKSRSEIYGPLYKKYIGYAIDYFLSFPTQLNLKLSEPMINTRIVLRYRSA